MWLMAQIDVKLQQVLEPLVENNPSLDIEAVEETLREVAEHPIDLNHTSTSELEQLLWLSPEQIDNILLYAYAHPFHSVHELMLVPGLRAYEVDMLRPFVCVTPREEKDKRTARDLFQKAGHEVDLRLDARALTTYTGDPVYGYIKYKCNAGNKVLMGLTFKRDAGEVPNVHSRYGLYAELRDIGPVTRLVIGDYRASFGYGLVINSALPLGKSTYATQLGMNQIGLHKYNGCSDDFLRGVGASVELLPKTLRHQEESRIYQSVQLSAFYSLRRPDSIMRQVAGLNISYTRNRLRIGATAVEYWTQDSVPVRNTYYNANYFRGTRQFTGSVNMYYRWQHVTLLGEAATSQNSTWGGAIMAGCRIEPVQDVSMLVLGRYYSKYYDAKMASTFSETSRPNDEAAAYVGTEIKLVKDWRFAAYTDWFYFSGPKYTIREASWGYDILAEAEYIPNEDFGIDLRGRTKRKGSTERYNARLSVNKRWGKWSLRSQLDGGFTHYQNDNPLTYGLAALAQVEYRFISVPMVLQARIEGFYVPNWNDRIYTYENDVLYAFSIPSIYGKGARGYINWRYTIGKRVSLYLRASETWYTRGWVEEKGLSSAHKVDIHALVKVKL